MSVLAGGIQFAAQDHCVRPLWSPQYYNRYFQFGLIGETYDNLWEAFGLGMGVPTAKPRFGWDRIPLLKLSPRVATPLWSARAVVPCASPRIGVRFK